MSLESIEKLLADLHAKYDLNEAKVDAAIKRLEESSFSAAGVVVLGIGLVIFGIVIGKVL